MFKNGRHPLIYYGIFLYCFRIANSQNVPYIPCPDIFKYMNSGGTNYGLVTLNNLPLQTTVVEVEFSQRQPIKSNYFGRLKPNQELITVQEILASGGPVEYRVDFPMPNMLPKLTNITVNGKTICEGQGLGAPSTTFKLHHTFYPAMSTTYDVPSIRNYDRTTNDYDDGYAQSDQWQPVPTHRPPMPTYPPPRTIYRPPMSTYLPATRQPPTTAIPQISQGNPFLNQFIGKPKPTIVYQQPHTPIQTISPQIIPESPQTTITLQTQTPVNGPVIRPFESSNIFCGQENLPPLIINGESYPPGEFSWLAVIFFRWWPFL